jgi:hypothetical protein
MARKLHTRFPRILPFPFIAPARSAQRVAQQLQDAFDIEPAECLHVSAKTGKLGSRSGTGRWLHRPSSLSLERPGRKAGRCGGCDLLALQSRGAWPETGRQPTSKRPTLGLPPTALPGNPCHSRIRCGALSSPRRVGAWGGAARRH